MTRAVRPLSPAVAKALALTALALISWAAATRAHAQVGTRTVLLRFEGWHADEAREAALQGLVGLELVDESTLIDTAAQIGVDVSTPEGMAAVVRHLNVALVIGGSVEGRNRSAQTSIWAMDASGSELARETTVGPGGRDSTADIAQATSNVVNTASSQLRSTRAPQAEVTAPPPQPSYEEEIAAEEDDTPRWKQPFLRALAGVRVRNRGAWVTPNTDFDRFDASFFPDLQLMVEARPLSGDAGPLRGLYFAVSGGVSAGIQYRRIPTAPMPDSWREMLAYNLELDAGYGLVLFERFELLLTVGLGADGVDLVGRTPQDFPSTTYSFFRPAVQGRVKILEDSELVIAEFGLGGRIAWDAGGMQGRYGTSASTAGLDVYLGVAGAIDLGFTWAARISYTGYWISIMNEDMARGGQDEAVQIWLLVGWSIPALE